MYQTIIITLFLLTFSAFGLIPCKHINQANKIKKNSNANLAIPLEKPFIYEETWDDGEVSWDMISNPIRGYVIEKHGDEENMKEITNREKIWGLVEELRIQGIISGVLSVAYYNTALGDSFLDDLQNFEIKPNMNFKNIIVNNFNSELDIILTLSTLVLYRSYKENRIPRVIDYWRKTGRNGYYIEEYRKVRRCATIFSLITIIIFCKSIKNAI